MMTLFEQLKSVYNNKRVLITGDTGFKGSWLCIWLRELGAQVWGYALPPLTERDNFVSTSLHEKITHRNGDIRDLEKLKQYFQEVKPEFTFHLAAQPLVIDSYKDPHYTFETNVMGTVNFFEAVRSCSSVKVAVNVTTDKCYENNEWVWGYRESDPMGGKDPYSASKGCSELVTTSYRHSFFSDKKSTLIASARAGNVIGGGDWAANRIMPDIIRSYLNKTELVIRNPNYVRPWQFVLEPVCGYLELASALYKKGKDFEGGWNFGPSSYERYTVNQVVETAKQMLPELKVRAEQPQTEKLHESGMLQLDINKAVNLLGWKPRLDFQQTIDFTVNGYIDELRSPESLYDKRVRQIREYCGEN